jgi:hypothetical protein
MSNLRPFTISDEVQFGTDFETGVQDKKTGTIIPVVGLLGGTKDNPISIGNGCYRQEDNAMAEFNTPPVKTAEDWLDFIKYCFRQGNEILGAHGAQLKPMASNFYTDEQLNSEKLRTLGCSPTYDAYLEDLRSPDGKATNMRTCGYHVHFGFPRRDVTSGTAFSIRHCFSLARYCDLFMGIPSVILDEDDDRRNLYGGPGEFRNKRIPDMDNPENEDTYIFEYRTLSGNLLTADDLIKWVLNSAKRVVKEYNNQTPLPPDDILKGAIATPDRKVASKLIKDYKIVLP